MRTHILAPVGDYAILSRMLPRCVEKAALWSMLTLGIFSCGDSTPAAHPPQAKLIAPAYCDLGTSIALDGSGSIDLGDDIVLYRFILSDGTVARETTTPQIQHICRIAGLIEARLEVIDALGEMGTASAVISVRRP